MKVFILFVFVILCSSAHLTFTEALKSDDTLDFKDLIYSVFKRPTGRFGPWSNWGRCRASCYQYRRKQCREYYYSLGLCYSLHNGRNNRYLYQKRKCPPEMCKTFQNISHNIDDFECGNRRDSSVEMRIIGGKESQPHSWPWHVNILTHRRFKTQICGGTLIHPQFVLTARHCVVEEEKNPFFIISADGGRRRIRRPERVIKPLYVRVGEHNINIKHPKQLTVQVEKVFTHPNHTKTNVEYDIALLKLLHPVTLNEHVKLACLPKPNSVIANLSANAMCTAVGFGKTSRRQYNSLSYSESMQEVNVYLTPHRQCAREFSRTDVKINPKIHVCATAKYKDTCQGDSGGGLFCETNLSDKWFVFGVTSFGHPRGCGLYSGVYQRISQSYTWIEETIKSELVSR